MEEEGKRREGKEIETRKRCTGGEVREKTGTENGGGGEERKIKVEEGEIGEKRRGKRRKNRR